MVGPANDHRDSKGAGAAARGLGGGSGLGRPTKGCCDPERASTPARGMDGGPGSSPKARTGAPVTTVAGPAADLRAPTGKLGGLKPVRVPRGRGEGFTLPRASHEEEPPEEERPIPPVWAAGADLDFFPLLRRPLRDLGWAALPLNEQAADEGVQPRLLH